MMLRLKFVIPIVSIVLGLNLLMLGLIDVGDTIRWESLQGKLAGAKGIEFHSDRDARVELVLGCILLVIGFVLAQRAARTFGSRSRILVIPYIVASLAGLGLFACVNLEPEIKDKLLSPNPDALFERLLSSRETFENKTVTLQGFGVCEFENTSLWLSESAFRRNHRSKVIWIDIDERNSNWAKFKALSKSYVRVSGTFSMQNSGHGGCYLGGLTNITAIDKQVAGDNR